MRLFNSVKVCLIVSAIFFSACADRKNISPFPSISEQTKADLKAPVNCATAQNDIKVLQDEKASVGKQMLDGVRSILPFAAVAGILMGDYRDRVEVATGQYNNDLDLKINQIKATCGIV